VQQLVAYSTLAATVTLALSRPRLRPSALRLSPGLAALFGVLVLTATGILRLDDLGAALRVQWRPLSSLAGIMVMTGVVDEVGAFERLAARIEAYARRTSAARAFALVFAVSVVTPSLLNNDSAILLLTPLVVATTRRLYPRRPDVTEAFAFAVFLAPGVAPFVVSNPMNMIVAEYAGIGFNAYTRVMAPISIAGALVTWLVLRWRFARTLGSAQAEAQPIAMPARHPAERPLLVLLAAVFLAYPITAALGGEIWMVTLAGALASLLCARALAVAPLPRLVGHVSLDILVFLWGVFLVVAGLRHVGVIERLATFYQAVAPASALGAGVVGATAAVGSALVDNHPMSILNMLALGAHGSPGSDRALLAALVGGDIGPRLLPIGSLAGLLWMELLRRAGAPVRLGRFVRLGTLVLLPTLTLSLGLLVLLAR
jgi:arsenical pump membrane protein